LVAVDALLRANQRVNIAAAVGMGGVGKTELALQYALRAGDGFPGGVCWLDGRLPLAPQMVDFAQIHLGLTVPEEVENPLAWCCQRWPGNEPVLMVVDDVQDYGALKPLLPGNPRFRVLLTTRQGILPPGQRLALEVLVPGAALDLLRSLVGPERIAAELSEAEALCEWVGRLPLGLELVGYYLSLRPELTIERLLERLAAKQLTAKALVDTYPAMTAELGVAAAFELSWEPLSAEAKLVAAALGLFAAAPIRWRWVEETLTGQEDEGWDEETLEDAQAELLRVHFLQVSGMGTATRYQVHPLVREFFAAKRPELDAAASLPQGFAQAMVQIAETVPYAVTLEVRSQITEAVPHWETVAAQWSEVLGEYDKITCAVRLAWFYQSLNQWRDAERCCLRSLTISQTQLGPRHPDTATSLNNLAELYRSMGRYVEAEPLFTEALEIRRAELGDRHPDTAQGLNNLALLYYSMGRYGEAEPFYTEALEIRKAKLGDRHPSTATSLNNLAELYRSMGRYGEAEPLYTKALEIWKAELGDRHPSTARGLNNLAALYQSMGRYGEAEPLYTEALKIWKAKLGDRHPDTATSLNNLAALYQSMGRYGEAEPFYTEALKIWKAELGDRHPSTAASLNNLASLYRSMGRYGEAEPLFTEALEICKAELGDRHPDTAQGLNNLAGLYYAMNRFPEAAAMMAGVVDIFEEILDPEHPNTVTGRENLGIIQQSIEGLK
jgi:tetratricopeptide (TPR) repeat protein